MKSLKELFEELKRIFSYDDRAHSCTRKQPHKSLEAAEKTCAKILAKKGKVLEAYKCRHCEFWHIGKPFEKKEKVFKIEL